METLIDKVVLAKGRVWTIYATDGNYHNDRENRGVWVFQGVKPYNGFKFDSSRNYLEIPSNYFSLDEIVFLEGDDIAAAVKKMQQEEKKKLTRKKAIDFFIHITGHSKAFVSKSIEAQERYISDAFKFSPGAIRMEIWKTDGAILLSENMRGTTRHSYFDFITFEPHDRLNERTDKAYREQIIDEFKEWKGIE